MSSVLAEVLAWHEMIAGKHLSQDTCRDNIRWHLYLADKNVAGVKDPEWEVSGWALQAV